MQVHCSLDTASERLLEGREMCTATLEGREMCTAALSQVAQALALWDIWRCVGTEYCVDGKYKI